MEITEKDKDVILGMFPKLKFISQNNEILLVGNLKFAAKYLKNLNNYKLLGSNDKTAEIKGEFKIEIDFSKTNPYRAVFETGGKIESLAKKLNKNLLGLHAKQNGKKDYINVCIAGYLQENQNINLVRFVCEIVVSYFCDLVVFEKEGYWPRGEYSHGALGVLENYSDLLNTENEKTLTEKCLRELIDQKQEFEILKRFLFYKRKLSGNWKGFCKNDPDKKLRDFIGQKAFDGLWKFKDNLKKFNLLSKIQ